MRYGLMVYSFLGKRERGPQKFEPLLQVGHKRVCLIERHQLNVASLSHLQRLLHRLLPIHYPATPKKGISISSSTQRQERKGDFKKKMIKEA